MQKMHFLRCLETGGGKSFNINNHLQINLSIQAEYSNSIRPL